MSKSLKNFITIKVSWIVAAICHLHIVSHQTVHVCTSHLAVVHVCNMHEVSPPHLQLVEKEERDTVYAYGVYVPELLPNLWTALTRFEIRTRICFYVKSHLFGREGQLELCNSKQPSMWKLQIGLSPLWIRLRWEVVSNIYFCWPACAHGVIALCMESDCEVAWSRTLRQKLMNES